MLILWNWPRINGGKWRQLLRRLSSKNAVNCLFNSMEFVFEFLTFRVNVGC